MMASALFAPDLFSRRRISLAEIDAVVSARLGPTRGLGNSQPACFNRQVAMYLAKHVGRWTVAIIGRFYNSRDHSKVCHSIQRIEALRESDPQVDALLTDLKRQLIREDNAGSASVVGDEHYCPTIRFRTAAEMLETFGMHKGGKEYRRLVAAFERIFGATIFFGTDSLSGTAGVVQRSRFSFFHEAQIWYSRDPQQYPISDQFENVIVLSDEFYREATAHPIPADLEAVKVLAGAPAVLDLFMWLSYRCFLAKDKETIPLFGIYGLANQLGSIEYARPRAVSRKARFLVGFHSRALAGVFGQDQPGRHRSHHRSRVRGARQRADPRISWITMTTNSRATQNHDGKGLDDTRRPVCWKPTNRSTRS